MHFDGNPERWERQIIDADGNFKSEYMEKDGTKVEIAAKYVDGNVSEKTVKETNKDGSSKITNYSGYKYMAYKTSYNIKTEEYNPNGEVVKKQQGSGMEYFNGITEEKIADSSFLEQVKIALNNLLGADNKEEGEEDDGINFEKVNIYSLINNFGKYTQTKEAEAKKEAEKETEEIKKEAEETKNQEQYEEFMKWFRELFEKFINKDG